jgi:hypothetical protein
MSELASNPSGYGRADVLFNLVEGTRHDLQTRTVQDSDEGSLSVDQTTDFKVLQGDRNPGAPHGKHRCELFVSQSYFVRLKPLLGE